MIPAAGLGTRFLPATKELPKELLPVLDRPVIQWAVEEAVASGADEIILVLAEGKEALAAHLRPDPVLERLLAERGKRELLDQVRAISSMINVSYVRQGETLGLGHAVLMAKDLIGDEPFAVMLGDDIIDSTVPCMKQMMEVFEKYGGPVIAVQQVPKDEISAYGVIDGTPEGPSGRVYKIKDMVEKPNAQDAPSDLAIIGRYILTPDIFGVLESTPRDKAGEIQLTNGLRALKERRTLYGCRFDGVRHDAGNKLGFLKATVEFALKREDLGAPFREYLKSLKL